MMTDSPDQPALSFARPHAIIVGYGLPGRFIAEILTSVNIPWCVIDQNPATAKRCGHIPVFVGDVRDEAILRQAGIDRAILLAMTVPIDDVAYHGIELARSLRPDLRIVARVNYTSTGLKLRRFNAEVIVAEQLIAREMSTLLQETLCPAPTDPLPSPK